MKLHQKIFGIGLLTAVIVPHLYEKGYKIIKGIGGNGFMADVKLNFKTGNAIERSLLNVFSSSFSSRAIAIRRTSNR